MWRVLAQVEELDLSGFEAAYRGDGVGRPAYDPKRVLALLVYCANKRFSSGSEIAQACQDDLGARLIMGGRVLDRSTVDRFRVRHQVAVRGLLAQTLALGDQAGLLGLDLVAGDGTKFVANAAMSSSVDEDTLVRQIARLEAQVDLLTAAWAEQVSADPDAADRDATAGMFDLFGPDSRPQEGAPTTGTGGGAAGEGEDTQVRGGEQVAWQKLQAAARFLASRQGLLQQMRERPSSAATGWAEKVQRDADRVMSCQAHLDATRARLQTAAQVRAEKVAAGWKISGRGAVPVEEHTHVRQARTALATATARAQASATAVPPTTTKINTTDPGSRIMPGKHQGFDQRYNVQVLACTSQLILAIELHDSPNDKRALVGLLHAARANLDAAGITGPLGTALFDAGYASEENFTADVPVDQLLVAVEREARQTQRLHDGTSHAAASWTQMTLTMAEPANITLYKRRSAIIEPVFAQLFALTGRDLPHRGAIVRTDLHLRAVIHNLNKITKATTHTPPPPKPS